MNLAPETPATKFLKAHHVPFSSHLYAYEEHGGTRVSARELNVDEHAVVKTLIFEDEAARPLVVLMHGDRKVSAKELARQIGCKKVEPCKPEVANPHTGSLVGGTSPYGTRKKMPIYLEKTILDLPFMYINGGRRGLPGRHPPPRHPALPKGEELIKYYLASQNSEMVGAAKIIDQWIHAESIDSVPEMKERISYLISIHWDKKIELKDYLREENLVDSFLIQNARCFQFIKD